MSILFKIFIFIFLIFSFNSKADFQRFDVVEITYTDVKTKHSGFIKKTTHEKKYAIVFSGNDYNKFSKNLIVAPLIIKTKTDYTGRFIFKFEKNNITYILFSDKLRNINKVNVSKSNIKLNEDEKVAVSNYFAILTK